MKGIFDLKEREEDTTSGFWPGDADPDKITDEEIKTFVRRNCATAFHPVSGLSYHILLRSVGTSYADALICPQW